MAGLGDVAGLGDAGSCVGLWRTAALEVTGGACELLPGLHPTLEPLCAVGDAGRGPRYGLPLGGP